jgi:hypothetical protein
MIITMSKWSKLNRGTAFVKYELYLKLNQYLCKIY